MFYFSFLKSFSISGIDDQVQTCENRCGSNAICKEVGGSIECECQRNFYGNPYLGCHPECITNSDCPHNSACSNFKCIDPCRGACGVNSQCTCINHVPICHCSPNQAGNPFVSCYPSINGKIGLAMFFNFFSIIFQSLFT